MSRYGYKPCAGCEESWYSCKHLLPDGKCCAECDHEFARYDFDIEAAIRAGEWHPGWTGEYLRDQQGYA